MSDASANEQWTAQWRLLTQAFLAGRSGDSASYRHALSQLALHLRQWLRRRASAALNATDREDLLQECLFAIHLKADTYDERYPLAGWVSAIAKYKLVDYFRRRRIDHRTIASTFDEEDMASSSDNDLDSRMDLATLLRRLPPKQRDAIEQMKLLGRTAEEASKHSGQSPTAIKVNVHRGLKALMTFARGSE